MRKGSKYADIFDSPETIKQAQLDGYSIVEKTEPAKTEPPKAAVSEKKNVENAKQSVKPVKR